MPSPQTGQFGSGPAFGSMTSGGLNVAVPEMTGALFATFDPPGGARNCAPCPIVAAFFDSRRMSEPPSLLFGPVPPDPSIFTAAAMLKLQPASEIALPTPFWEPPLARMFCATDRPANCARP